MNMLYIEIEYIKNTLSLEYGQIIGCVCTFIYYICIYLLER